ncbi:MAG: rod shape-determining protein MreC [Dehalococcoidia bacterium]
MRVRSRTWFGFVVAASLLLILASRLTYLGPLESGAVSIAAPIESALRTATRPVADFVNNLTDVNRLSDENQSLRETNELLTSQVTSLREQERDAQQYRQLIEQRGIQPGETLVAANVFARDPSNVRDAIAIDLGSGDGLQEGMIVLTQQGSLIGSIDRVLSDAAWVTLITDPTSAVSARIQESRTEGVVVGSADGTLTMEFVQETADVKAGDLVLTSGIGGRHPPGELIGQVVEVDGSGSELFKAVHIESLAGLNQLEKVLVLTSFMPQKETAP